MQFADLPKTATDFMNKLQPKEYGRLKKLEAIIKEGEKQFVEVGLALTEIQQSKLYREGYETFEDYCQNEWGWTRKNAYALIAAAPIAKCNPEVTSVKSAVALSKVPPPRRKEVVEEIVKSGQKVTEQAIKKASQPPPKPARTILMDGTGIEVPPASLSLWSRSSEVQSMLTMLSSVRGALRKAQEDKDALFAEVDFSGTLAQLNQAYVDIQRAKPYAICHSCNGKTPKSCQVCKGRGFVSEFFWKHAVPEEVRKLREE